MHALNLHFFPLPSFIFGPESVSYRMPVTPIDLNGRYRCSASTWFKPFVIKNISIKAGSLFLRSLPAPTAFHPLWYNHYHSVFVEMGQNPRLEQA